MSEPFITIRIRDALGVDKNVDYTEKQVRIMCRGGVNGPALEVANKIMDRYDALAARLAEAEALLSKTRDGYAVMDDIDAYFAADSADGCDCGMPGGAHLAFCPATTASDQPVSCQNEWKLQP